MRTNERGYSVAVEAAIIIPALVLLIGLVATGAQLALANQQVGAAAAHAARTAAMARDTGSAPGLARDAVAAMLADSSCDNPVTTVSVVGVIDEVGQQGQFVVGVSCELTVLGLPGLPSRFTVSQQRRAPIDSYRSR
ncbi:MAG: hypothetical protein CSA64_01630 [Arachnia propionica]|nr:MAG: hypothetical protein CSA64_01630 [Arachnia propionica]